MARKKREEKITDPFERARIKKLRAAARREERKQRRAKGEVDERRSSKAEVSADYSKPMVRDSYEWIRRSLTQAFAWKIVNSHRERPYWLSIPWEGGSPPVSHFYPCTMMARDGRLYYGFLFTQCRDELYSQWRDEYNARKEKTGRDNGPLIS